MLLAPQMNSVTTNLCHSRWNIPLSMKISNLLLTIITRSNYWHVLYMLCCKLIRKNTANNSTFMHIFLWHTKVIPGKKAGWTQTECQSVSHGKVRKSVTTEQTKEDLKSQTLLCQQQYDTDTETLQRSQYNSAYHMLGSISIALTVKKVSHRNSLLAIASYWNTEKILC